MKKLLLTASITCFLLLGCQSKTPLTPSSQAALTTIDVLDIFPSEHDVGGVQLHLALSDMIEADKIHEQGVKFSHEVIFTLVGIQNQVISLPDVKQNALIEAVGVRETEKNTQVIIDFKQAVDYSYTLSGRDVTLTFFPKTAISLAEPKPDVITGVRYHDKVGGGGDIVINMLGAIALHVESSKDVNVFNVHIDHAILNNDIDKMQDVDKLGSLVKSITVTPDATGVLLRIETKGKFSESIKTFNDKLIVTIKPSELNDVSEKVKKDSKYKGAPANFHFQDIQVDALLEIIADFSGLNIIVSDTVKGSISLNLKNTPWDEVLDIILQSQSLGMRRYGDIILVAPAAELANREYQDLQAAERLESLAPLYTELIHLRYAKAEDVQALLKETGGSLLTTRGQINIDKRTNTLWIRDTSSSLDEIRNLVNRLDVAVSQVLIEARILSMNTKYEQEIGVRLGVTRDQSLTGTLTQDGASPPPAIPLANRLGFNLPALGGAGVPAASLGLTLFKLDSRTLLDLEISALEQEGKVRLMSTPRLVTSNQQEATIETGEEIPYQESTSSGATNIAFKKAVLSLTVTPRITPNNKIILDLKVNRDTRGTILNGVPAINTQSIKTQVLLNDGETVVLGGVYQRDTESTINQVPFLGALPMIGRLFRYNDDKDTKDELLIFITPKVLKGVEHQGVSS